MIEFKRNHRSEKVIHTQSEISLTISLLEMSIKECIAKQQEPLCKELHYNNPLKFWDNDKAFAKITLLNNKIII